ncbi:MAG: hypothetical protein J6583_13380 [Gilliamella sp.]|uniref:hypothetical protein n=1 Tax=Gilliamella sp. TaxID=1891236 RepID=UPI0025E22FF0|nr:hypothetical protein [Gilliamella sp.]MCO6545333.1 hypothetical protein [Gilliamella sp.]MCO6548744.1 hypothetical protein [Gilliamella sp.]
MTVAKNQRRFKRFNVIDDLNRINIVVSLPDDRVVLYLDELAECHGYRLKIRVDNSSEFTGENLYQLGKITLSPLIILGLVAHIKRLY